MEGDVARATDAAVEEEAVEEPGLLAAGFFAALVLVALVVGVVLDVGAEVAAGATAVVVGIVVVGVGVGVVVDFVGVVVVVDVVVDAFPEGSASFFAVPRLESGISIDAAEACFPFEIVFEAPAEGSADEVAVGAPGSVAPRVGLAVGLAFVIVKGGSMPTARTIVSEVEPLGPFPTDPSLAVARQATDAPIPRAISAIDCATDANLPALAPRSSPAALGAPPVDGFLVAVKGDEDASAVDVPWGGLWPPKGSVARPEGAVLSGATVVSSRVEVDAPGIAPRQTVSVFVAVSPIALSDSSESPSLRVPAAVPIEASADPPAERPAPPAAPHERGASDPSEALGATPVGVGSVGVGSVDALDTSVSRVETTS